MQSSFGSAVAAMFDLRPSGDAWSGACPLDPAHATSFVVNAAGEWHCPACVRTGSAAHLLKLTANLAYPDAVATLIGRPMTLAQDPNGNRALRSVILSANDFATTYFQDALRDDTRGATARRYLHERGFPADTLEQFGIGYAPSSAPGDHDFMHAFHAAGFTTEDGIVAGLLAQSERGVYPFFRNRIIIPMRTATGDTIGFGGRALGSNPRRYVNTSLTPVHQKGAALFGMDHAQRAIVDASFAIVVEGYFDAIAMQVAGFTNTVAALGTSFTTEQARSIVRLGASATAIFDGDDAGRRAASRSYEIAAQVGLSVRVASLPDGLDPDEILKRDGPFAIRAALAAATSESQTGTEDQACLESIC